MKQNIIIEIDEMLVKKDYSIFETNPFTIEFKEGYMFEISMDINGEFYISNGMNGYGHNVMNEFRGKPVIIY